MKKAPVTMQVQTINGMVVVNAHGPAKGYWQATDSIHGRGYTVTHIPSGLGAGCYRKLNDAKKVRDALAVIAPFALKEQMEGGPTGRVMGAITRYACPRAVFDTCESVLVKDGRLNSFPGLPGLADWMRSVLEFEEIGYTLAGDA